jgi:hypothetical protein
MRQPRLRFDREHIPGRGNARAPITIFAGRVEVMLVERYCGEEFSAAGQIVRGGKAIVEGSSCVDDEFKCSREGRACSGLPRPSSDGTAPAKYGGVHPFRPETIWLAVVIEEADDV